MSCHDIGRALNYVQEEIIEQYEASNLDKNTAKALLKRSAEAVCFCDGNLDEATASFDKYYCSDCMCKSQELYTLYLGYQWYDAVRNYVEEHNLVGTNLCEACFEKMLTALRMTPEEIEKLKTEQLNNTN